MDESALRIAYETHDEVRALIDRLHDTLESISLSFDRWDEQYIKGPGLYVAVVTGPSIASFADPMGRNRWPTDRCRSIRRNGESLFETAREVALSRDGAVVVGVDGVIQPQMVRFTDPRPEDLEESESAAPEYEDWMGSRHMSALDTSRRPNVVSTLTLSEETGRVTRFEGGAFETTTRSALGGEWNPHATA